MRKRRCYGTLPAQGGLYALTAGAFSSGNRFFAMVAFAVGSAGFGFASPADGCAHETGSRASCLSQNSISPVPCKPSGSYSIAGRAEPVSQTIYRFTFMVIKRA